MSTTMTTPEAAEQARKGWRETLKFRKHLEKQIHNLKADSATGTDMAHFGAIEETMAMFRLGCVGTSFADFEYAVSVGVGDVLWSMHTAVNDQYRRILRKLRQDERAVEARKVESKYANFLSTAQKFYIVYIQRLAARYDLPDLKRVAYGVKAKEMPPPENIMSTVPAGLASKVLASCHATVMHLGDLARYRMQTRHKKYFGMALTYYGIAHELDPGSGFPFHQMGIVNLEEENHLEVIYYFYRAWAIKNPHPSARPNLEAKFRDARQKPNPTSRGKGSPSANYDALTMWFVRLHGLFYKGDPVSARHKELELEVIHRLSMAAKDANAAPMLLKMSLVNMAACWVASTKYNDRKAESANRFHQYALHFSARFLLKLCEVIESAFKDSPPECQNEANAIPPTVTILLPVLRIYCNWIACRRHEIFGSANAPANVVPHMIESLARVLNYFCAKIPSDAPPSCPYVLPEDIEAHGLLPLSDDDVPAPRGYYCTEGGRLEPRLDPGEKPLDAPAEAVIRMLDVLRSAYFLSEDPSVPLTCVQKDQLEFQYQPAGVPEQVQNSNEAIQTPRTSANGDAAAPAAEANGIAPMQSPGVPSGPRGDQQGATRSGRIPEPLAPQATNKSVSRMNDADRTVVNMLSPFLDCPTSKSEEAAQSPEEPSYGMHTTTANELAQELLKSFQPEKDELTPYYESLNAGQFGSSTWTFFTTTPPQANAAGSTTRARPLSGHYSSNHSPRGSVPTDGVLVDPFATPGRRAMSNMQPQQLGSNMSSPGFSTADVPRSNHMLQHGTNSPREASLSSWPTNQGYSAVGQASNSWAQQTVHSAQQGIPASSAVSGFSHPSSLYQGPPNGAMYYGQPGPSNAGYNLMQQNGPTQGGASSGSSRSRWDATASSYDAAVFQGALRGNK